MLNAPLLFLSFRQGNVIILNYILFSSPPKRAHVLCTFKMFIQSLFEAVVDFQLLV